MNLRISANGQRPARFRSEPNLQSSVIGYIPTYPKSVAATRNDEPEDVTDDQGNVFRVYAIDGRTGYIIVANITETVDDIDPFDGYAKRLELALELLQQLKTEIENYNAPR